MSGQLTEEIRPLLDRCLVVIFKSRKSKNADIITNDYEVPVSLQTPIENEADPADTSLDNSNARVAGTDTLLNLSGSKPVKSLSGVDLFEEFVQQNKGCFWDPHLEESLKNVQVLGCVYPHTVLIGGRDIYLDTVRAAWSRKVLQPPASFTIHKIGELHNVEMQLVSQAQFTPLPEALCMIISDMNKVGSSPATFEEILKHLKKKYKNVHQPSEEIVYEALGNLLKERKIYHTGHGYHIITPELFAHLNHINGFATLQECGLAAGRPNTLMMPGSSPLPVAEMSSIACQTEQVEEEPLEKEDSSKKKLLRSNSLRETRKTSAKDKKASNETFSRSTSLRLDQEKAKGLVKDINLKTSEVHQEKEKSDKTSLLSKLFGSGKSKKKQPQNSIPEEQERTVEYATFSAQFPPPDLQWYETQAKAALLFQWPASVPERRRVTKSGTFHYLQQPDMVDAEAQSDIFEDEYPFRPACPIHKSKTLPENLTAEFYHGRMRERSYSSHSQESSRQSQGECLENRPNATPESPALPKSRKVKTCHRDKSREDDVAMNGSKEFAHNLNEISCADQSRCETYIGKHTARNHKKPLSSNNKDTEAIYEDIADMKRNPSSKRMLLNNGAADPASIRQDNGEFGPVADEVCTSTKPPLPNQPRSNKGFKNSSHKNRIYKRYKEMNCGGGSPPARDDISIEYNGRMPVKSGSYAKSRDSGVNCIGLTELQPCVTVPLSEEGSLNSSGEYTGEKDQLEVHDRVQLDVRQSFSRGMEMTSTPNQCSTRNNNHEENTSTANVDVVVHRAEIHRIPEESDALCGSNGLHKGLEDSGFNSPHQGNHLYSPYSYGSGHHQPQNNLGNSFTHHQTHHSQVFTGQQLKGLADSTGCDVNNFVNNNNHTTTSVRTPYSRVTRGFIETDLDHPSLDGSPREGSPTQNNEEDETTRKITPRAFQLLQPEKTNQKSEGKKSHSGQRHHHERKNNKHSKRERPKSTREDWVSYGHDGHIQESSSHKLHNGLTQDSWLSHNGHIQGSSSNKLHNGLDQKSWLVHNGHMHESQHSSRRSLTHLDKHKMETSLQTGRKEGDFEVVGVL